MSIFYGVPLYWNKQAQRKATVQDLANPDMFVQEEKEQIRKEVMPYLMRVERISKGMKEDKKLWLAVQMWVEQRIKYVSDIRQFGTLEYFSTAREVWDQGMEDCDGRAVLAAAVLKMMGRPEAKIATNTVHAEVSLTSDVLPEPTPKPEESKEQFSKRRFWQQLPERVASIPWGRAAVGVIWYWMCGMLAHRVIGKKVPRRVAVELLLLFTINIILEGYSQLYLFQSNF